MMDVSFVFLVVVATVGDIWSCNFFQKKQTKNKQWFAAANMHFLPWYDRHSWWGIKNQLFIFLNLHFVVTVMVLQQQKMESSFAI